MLNRLVFIPYLSKSAATEATALKTQTPIVAKLTDQRKGIPYTLKQVEIAFLQNPFALVYVEKRYNIPHKEIIPFSTNIQLV